MAAGHISRSHILTTLFVIEPEQNSRAANWKYHASGVGSTRKAYCATRSSRWFLARPSSVRFGATGQRAHTEGVKRGGRAAVFAFVDHLAADGLGGVGIALGERYFQRRQQEDNRQNHEGTSRHQKHILLIICADIFELDREIETTKPALFRRRDR
jgi:hypothetical protein